MFKKIILLWGWLKDIFTSCYTQKKNFNNIPYHPLILLNTVPEEDDSGTVQIYADCSQNIIEEL